METAGTSRISRRRIATRRGVVIVLLIICILLLTSFFRESDQGFLHSLKGTVTDLASPVQGAASAAVKPVRNLVGWIKDSRSAANQRDALQAQVEGLRAELARLQVNRATSDEYVDQRAAQLQLSQRASIADQYAITTASVVSRQMFETRQSARIDKGRNDGVTENSLAFVPARAGDGKAVFGALVGRVTRVDANTSRVTFITDPTQPVAVQLLNGNTTVPLGLLRANGSGDLILSGVPSRVDVKVMTQVVTRGAGIATLQSPYPPGLLIGYVTSVGQASMNSTWTLQVDLFRDPQDLGTLTILIPKSAEAKHRAGVG